jgi:hypothetical protein
MRKCADPFRARRSTLLFRNTEKPAHRNSHHTYGPYSIPIIPISITVTAAPAASFLLPNRKRLGTSPVAQTKLIPEPFPMLASSHSGTIAKSDLDSTDSIPCNGADSLQRFAFHADLKPPILTTFLDLWVFVHHNLHGL